jgi:cytochrome c553
MFPMSNRYMPNILTAIVFLAVAGALVWLGVLSQADEEPTLASGRPLPAVESNQYTVASPPFSEGIYPCSRCHNPDLHAPDANHRDFPGKHKDIVLRHDAVWCLDCHDTDNRDVLRRASGGTIQFEESYQLCGQCHGERLRDWKAGVHGKRTGQWNGKKDYLLCVNCHNPHSPRYQPMAPMPPPVKPQANN